MTRRVRLGAAVACAVCLRGTSAAAQGDLEPLPGRVEVSGGLVWTRSTPFGSSDATLTSPAGDRYRLFSTSSELTRATGVELRVGGRLSRLVQAELTASYATPRLSTSIGSDAENAAAIIASESITQVTVAGAGVVHLPFLHVGRRALPFVTAGTGYLRQLHEGATLVETGRTYHVGGGVKLSLFGDRHDRRVKQVGLRADVGVMIRSGGLAPDGRAHAAPAIAASLFARF